MPAHARALTEEAVWQHADNVARLAQQLCQHRDDAEDIAQTSLLVRTRRELRHRVTGRDRRALA